MSNTPLPSFPPGVALVVGGSGGLGRAICAALAREGTDVALTYRGNLDGAEVAAKDVRDAGAEASVHRLDLADVDACRALLTELATRDGGVHSVVFASGPDIAMPYVSRVEAGQWTEAIDADIHGFFHLVQASIPALRAHGGGSLTALSTAGLDRYPHRDILSVAPKAAVEAVVRGIAVEEGRFGVRANSVRVGVVEAGMFLRLQDKGFDPAWIETARARTPLGRFGAAHEVADAVVFLASSRASYITGQSLTVDGGWSV
jgi:NAD(P)-dependent dehydrogenase (short-subunit alcohol dehydrogenase family)